MESVSQPRPAPNLGTHLRIGDLVIRISSSEPELPLVVNGAARRFVVDPAPADSDIVVGWIDGKAEDAGTLLFDSGGVWQLWERCGRREIRCSSPAYGPSPYKIASFEPEFDQGVVRLQRDFFDHGTPVDALEYPLDELLVTNLLSRREGVEIHACGLIDRRGRGYLFAGHSGAGKTTLARLFDAYDEVTILSDDRIVIRAMADGGFRIHGTPWHGEAELAAPQSAPLAALFFIEHGPQNGVAPESATAAVARLVSCTFAPLYDSDAVARTLELLVRLVSTVRCERLTVVPDRSVVEFVTARTGR